MQRSNTTHLFARAAAFCLSLIFAFTVISTVHAQTTVPSSGVSSPSSPTQTPGVTSPSSANTNPAQETIANPLKYSDLNSLLSAVLSALVQIGSILLTLAIVWVGFRFVAARGNEEAIRSARTALMWTIIGGLILLGATAIQSVLTSTVNSISS